MPAGLLYEYGMLYENRNRKLLEGDLGDGC
jgi:hypothetical protein